MKGINLFCSSPASTAICTSIDHKSMVRDGTRSIDHENAHILNHGRANQGNPCPQSPFKPKLNRQKRRISSLKQTDRSCPPGSSRYLLSDSAFFDINTSDFNTVSVPVFHPMNSRSRSSKDEETPKLKSSSTTISDDQVVVLRVSLHCKGCEAKVRKHISRMQGVTSFNIDFSSKKVTVIGNLSPSEVLTSISKVKNAQLCPPSSPSSLSISS